MSILQDNLTPESLDRSLAARLLAEREARGWSLAELAHRSGVSRAMISKVERAEASPTAALLGRLSGAFGLTLSALLARAEGDVSGRGRGAKPADQTVWRDPATGYLRRAVSPPGADPELVEVELPPGACVAYPASAYEHLNGLSLWMRAGRLAFQEAAVVHRLEEGDCLTMSRPAACEFLNPSADKPCRYLIALARR